jgi:hypothetical protein
VPRPNSFYANIEAPIRTLVRLLRDHGWNTTCSCGHGMWVELDLYGFMDDLEALRCLLLDHGYHDFTIKADLRCVDQWPVRRASVYLGDYIPADGTSYRELSAKIVDFKERSERMHQALYRTRCRLKEVKEQLRKERRWKRK